MEGIGNVEQLRAAVEKGERLKFLFFWGHQPSPDGRVTKSCFSQWWEAPFTLDGLTYSTTEQYMMASKARLFGDEATLQRILAAKHPKQAKQEGRLVAGFDETTWAKRRFEFVVAGNVAKFGQHPELGSFLASTSRRVLVEASPEDPIWGIGLAADHPDATRPDRWPGLNLLGFALMEARARLQASGAAS